MHDDLQQQLRLLLQLLETTAALHFVKELDDELEADLLSHQSHREPRVVTPPPPKGRADTAGSYLQVGCTVAVGSHEDRHHVGARNALADGVLAQSLEAIQQVPSVDISTVSPHPRPPSVAPQSYRSDAMSSGMASSAEMSPTRSVYRNSSIFMNTSWDTSWLARQGGHVLAQGLALQHAEKRKRTGSSISEAVALSRMPPNSMARKCSERAARWTRLPTKAQGVG